MCRGRPTRPDRRVGNGPEMAGAAGDTIPARAEVNNTRMHSNCGPAEIYGNEVRRGYVQELDGVGGRRHGGVSELEASEAMRR